MDTDDLMTRCRIEARENWRELGFGMPVLYFPPGWGVQVIPPFGGATTRFVVTNSHGARISVYSDHYAKLGAMQRPYWEIHCVGGGLAYDCDDCQRFFLDETDALIAAIARFGDPAANMRDALTGETK